MSGRLECDHVRPVFMGGLFWDPSNIQALCRNCHIKKTRAENQKRFAAENPRLAPKLEAWKRLVNELILPCKNRGLYTLLHIGEQTMNKERRDFRR